MVRIHAHVPSDERQKEMRLVAAPLSLADVMMDEMIYLADGMPSHSLAPERQPNSGGFFHDRCGSY
ncbi:hypothetical protein YWY31_38910 [Paenibacillus illinoisensis]